MTFKKKYTEYIIAFSAIFFIGMIISAPTVCAEGAKKGLKICVDVLIPALFPFAVPVLFLINTPAFKKTNHKLLAVFFLSLIGGYPIGAKMISELYKNKTIDKYTAAKILPLCINAGPAFIVIAIGKGLLNNVKLGFVLFFSHICASIILALIFIPKVFFCKLISDKNRYISTADNFVLSVNSASDACVSICAFVILFSVICEYIAYYSHTLKPLSFLLYVLEVTTAVSFTKNIYIISFLLGFTGISVWMQILSLCENIKPKMITFVFIRIMHGVISSLITIVLLKVLKISTQTISTNTIIYRKNTYSGLTLSLSLLVMSVLLLINVFSKKHSGNIIKDMV